MLIGAPVEVCLVGNHCSKVTCKVAIHKKQLMVKSIILLVPLTTTTKNLIQQQNYFLLNSKNSSFSFQCRAK